MSKRTLPPFTRYDERVRTRLAQNVGPYLRGESDNSTPPFDKLVTERVLVKATERSVIDIASLHGRAIPFIEPDGSGWFLVEGRGRSDQPFSFTISGRDFFLKEKLLEQIYRLPGMANTYVMPDQEKALMEALIWFGSTPATPFKPYGDPRMYWLSGDAESEVVRNHDGESCSPFEEDMPVHLGFMAHSLLGAYETCHYEAVGVRVNGWTIFAYSSPHRKGPNFPYLVTLFAIEGHHTFQRSLGLVHRIFPGALPKDKEIDVGVWPVEEVSPVHKLRGSE